MKPKKTESTGKSFISKSSVDFYRQIPSQVSDVLSFEFVSGRAFKKPIICSAFSEELSLFFLGHDNGIIRGINFDKSSGFSQTDFLTIEAHKNRVTGLIVDLENRSLISIAADGNLKVISFEKKEIIKSLSLCASTIKLTEVILEKKNQRIVVADEKGKIHIISYPIVFFIFLKQTILFFINKSLLKESILLL